MSRLKLTVAVIAWASISTLGTAQAQTIEDGRRAAPHGAQFEVGFSVSEDDGARRIVEIFSLPDYKNETVDGLFPRLRFAKLTPSGSVVSTDIQWADARACPQIINVLIDLDGLTLPRFRFPNLLGSPPLDRAAKPPLVPPIHGPTFSIWGVTRQPDGAFADVVVSASVGLAADWAAISDERLRGCWRREQPEWSRR